MTETHEVVCQRTIGTPRPKDGILAIARKGILDLRGQLAKEVLGLFTTLPLILFGTHLRSIAIGRRRRSAARP